MDQARRRHTPARSVGKPTVRALELAALAGEAGWRTQNVFRSDFGKVKPVASSG